MTDGGGLYVAVAPTGKKTWRYQYALDGKRPEVTIGGYPEISVVEARERHAEYRALVEKGIDPAKHKQEEKRGRVPCGRNPFSSKYFSDEVEDGGRLKAER